MADEIDRAQDINEAHQREALSAHFRNRRTLPEAAFAPTECEDCGDPIPEARQQAAPGCIRCVNCQRGYEMTIKRPRSRARSVLLHRRVMPVGATETV